MLINQLENIKEIATAPFGADKELTKTMYAKKMALLEEHELKVMNELEPMKAGVSPQVIQSKAENIIPQLEEGLEAGESEYGAKKIIKYNDFDYVNPATMQPEGLAESLQGFPDIQRVSQ